MSAAALQNVDFSSFAEDGKTPGSHRLYLMVDGMRCASCAWNIESVINRENEAHARINLSTRRMVVDWAGAVERGNQLIGKATELGFRFMPFDPARQENREENEERHLLKCIAVSGFASGNLMAFSLALWFSTQESMGTATRDLMHWISALIAMPAIFYAGQPYFRSAWNALRSWHTNMDVPISLAVVLAGVMSLFETFRHGEYVYFDSSVMLLFFLLIGRYLDKKARGKARTAARDLLAMLQGTATVLENGNTRTLPIRDIAPGMRLQVATGEKIAADGIVFLGVSEVDTSLITGETLPQRVEKGQKVFAGMINMSAPIQVDVSAANEQSLLADIVRLMENAEQNHSRYVRLADKVAGYYTPVVHLLALVSFLGWILAGLAWQKALLIATTVLIITCPCALGLAVPVVQVIASSRLFRRGMLLKSGDALERLAQVDTVVLDKTGTLTLGKPQLTNAHEVRGDNLRLAASLASHSRHPLSRALSAAYKGELIPLQPQETPGSGLSAIHNGRTLRLGRRSWCGEMNVQGDDQLELWLAADGSAPVRFTFSDVLRADAADTVKKLRQNGLAVILLSGDRNEVASSVAGQLAITEYRANITPVQKADYIRALSEKGSRVLMVGDGLNDAPALAGAHVSMSPSSAMDITQNVADIVFQGESLSPVTEAISVAKASVQLVKQNFALSFLYNILAVPLAMAGMVTPLIAAIAMSSSSLVVIANALRLNGMVRR